MSLQVIKKTAAAAAPAKTLVKAMSMSTYTERQARLGRPVSPHVTIYSFPITALASITNRATGVGLTAGFAATSALAAIGADVPSLIYAAQDAIPGFAPISKLLVAFPITYHSISAARHTLWDKMPQFINNVDGPKSSYAVYASSIVLSLAAAAYTIKAPVNKDE